MDCKIIIVLLIVGMMAMVGAEFGGRTEKQVFNNFIVEVRNNLQKRKAINRVEFGGTKNKWSTTRGADHEVVFVHLDRSVKAKESEEYPGYVTLITMGSPLIRDQALDTFRSELKRSLLAIGSSEFASITNAVGPTTVVDYHRQGDAAFKVDVIYAIDNGDNVFIPTAPADCSKSKYIENMWFKQM